MPANQAPEVGTATPEEVLEIACANAWPPVHQERLGGWRLRAAGGFTGRANSTLAVGDPGVGIDAALHRVRKFAAAHKIPPKVQAIAGSSNERAVVAAGWRDVVEHSTPGGVLVLTAPLGGLTEGSRAGRVHDAPPPAWWPLTLGTDAAPDPATRGVLTGGERVGYGLVGRAAAVRGALVADPASGAPLLHIARLAVATGHRRRGLARRLLATLADWAVEHGARVCVLQVSSDNAAALALYRGLGCVERYRYRYWGP